MLEYQLFHLPRKLLRIFKCWPDDICWARTRIIFIVLTFTNHVVQMSFEFKYVFENFENPLETFDALNPFISKLITFFKICTILYYRNEFKYNHAMITSYFNRDYKGLHHNIVLKATRSAYRYCLYIFLGGFSTNLGFFLRPMVNNLVKIAIGGNVTRDIPFKASIPLDLNQNPTYQIVYILNSYSGLLTCVGFSAIDGMIMAYCKYLAVQFDIISNQLRTNFDVPVVEGCKLLSKHENLMFSKKLRIAMKAHIQLIIRITELSEIIAPIILSHFISSALEIGLSLVDFIKLKGYSTILYLVYAFVILLELLVYCIAGTCLSEATQGIHDSVYFTPWYRLDVRNRKDLLLMMIISTKGTCLRVPFFVPSLPVYRAVLSASLSYVAILLSFL